MGADLFVVAGLPRASKAQIKFSPALIVFINQPLKELHWLLTTMKQFLKEWGIPILVFIIAIPVYLYFNNPSFSYQVDRALDEPPYLSLKNNSLYIDEFKFTVGMVGFNQVSGDFDKLNEKVYDLLKGKSGKYEVFLKVKNKDKYGNTSEEYQSFGSVDADELNKYKSAKYWNESGGMQVILTGNDTSNDAYTDSAVVVDVPLSNLQSVQPVTDSATTLTTQTFHFNSMTGKPWTYYDVSNGTMNELRASDDGIVEAIQYWRQFVEDIQDIDVECRSKSAMVSITTATGVSEFRLNKVNPTSYNLEGNPSIALHVISPAVCKIFFMSEGSCVSVTNKSIKL